MPIGQTFSNGKVTFNDTSYNGVIVNGVLKDGTGILTDGKFGPDNATQDEGKGWVGWSRKFSKSSYIEISFEFSGVRKFKDVALTVNVDKRRSYAVFKRSQIFLASIEDQFVDTVLHYCPKLFSDDDIQYKRIVTLSLCGNTARFIKIRLYLGGRWLLITEISFNSLTGILVCPFFENYAIFMIPNFAPNLYFIMVSYILFKISGFHDYSISLKVN